MLWCQIPGSHAFAVCSWDVGEESQRQLFTPLFDGRPMGLLGGRLWCVQPSAEGCGAAGLEGRNRHLCVLQ